MLVPWLRSAEEKSPASRWVSLSLSLFVAAMFLVTLAAISLVPAWVAVVVDWELVVAAAIFAPAVCIRATLRHRMAFLAVVWNVCTASLVLFALVSAALLTPHSTGLAEGWPLLAWFASPYAGFCILALIFCHNRAAPKLIFAGTIFSVILALIGFLGFGLPALADKCNGIEAFEDLRPVILLAVPLLQWGTILVVLISCLVVLLFLSPQHGRKIRIDEI